MVKIAASILAANSDRLDLDILDVCNSGCDMIHIDVMDGKFVTNKTDGKCMMKFATKTSSVPLDVHLMVENPLKHLKYYLKAECITFHIEAVKDEKEIDKIINYLRSKNIRVGIAIKPNTSIGCVEKYIENIDKVLVMTVEPGYGGQALIPETLNKVKSLRKKYSNLDIQVDGGINLETCKMAIDVGANILVAGTAIFKSDNMKETINQLKR